MKASDKHWSASTHLWVHTVGGGYQTIIPPLLERPAKWLHCIETWADTRNKSICKYDSETLWTGDKWDFSTRLPHQTHTPASICDACRFNFNVTVNHSAPMSTVRSHLHSRHRRKWGAHEIFIVSSNKCDANCCIKSSEWFNRFQLVTVEPGRAKSGNTRVLRGKR